MREPIDLKSDVHIYVSHAHQTLSQSGSRPWKEDEYPTYVPMEYGTLYLYDYVGDFTSCASFHKILPDGGFPAM